MNPVQDMINALVRELKASLPSPYTVEAREPAEGELVANASTRQVFITTEGLEYPAGFASFGKTVRVRVPVMVACIMQRPGKITLAAEVLARRLSIARAVARAVNTFMYAHEGIQVELLEERPELIEGFYVSVTGLEMLFDMSTEETV